MKRETVVTHVFMMRTRTAIETQSRRCRVSGHICTPFRQVPQPCSVTRACAPHCRSRAANAEACGHRGGTFTAVLQDGRGPKQQWLQLFWRAVVGFSCQPMGLK